MGPNQLSQHNLYQILKRNSELKIGAFEMIYNGKNYVLRFNAKVSADMDSKALNTILTLVLKVSDDLEKELTDTDEN